GSGVADRDGVRYACDLCPATPALELVTTSGCSISPCEGPAAGGTWPDHATYVNSVTAVANQLYLAGTLSKTRKTAVITHAQKSTCGTANIRCCTWSKLVYGSMGSCAAMAQSNCNFTVRRQWPETRRPGRCDY